ncbi:MAG TPA: prephenate dehydratase, partial [Rhodobacteraceae bacterium]|nr:prephenate dehydratase [Paracoccaceae bacterium]
AEAGDASMGALSSELAGALYGLDLLARHIEDNAHNTTRFLVTAPTPVEVSNVGKIITTLIFEVRNIPAALYKAMGGFATNSVNMLKLESYMVDGSFTATQFYADIEGHPEDAAVQRALEELAYFTNSTRILGTYPESEFRETLA